MINIYVLISIKKKYLCFETCHVSDRCSTEMSRRYFYLIGIQLLPRLDTCPLLASLLCFFFSPQRNSSKEERFREEGKPIRQITETRKWVVHRPQRIPRLRSTNAKPNRSPLRSALFLFFRRRSLPSPILLPPLSLFILSRYS